MNYAFLAMAGLSLAACGTLAAAESVVVPLPLEEGDLPLEMIWVPPGTFLMGSPPGEKGRFDDETQHDVTISKGFYLSKYETTQAQWIAAMGSNPSVSGEGGNLPAENITWHVASLFADTLGQMGYGGFRLPTEAEWEYACRAGAGTRFYWGDDPDEALIGDYAWYLDNMSGSPMPAGLKLPNAWGFHDISGNAWEWCADWYAPYPEGPAADPAGPDGGRAKVVRGGFLFDIPAHMRSAHRGDLPPDFSNGNLGVRLAMAPPAACPEWMLHR